MSTPQEQENPNALDQLNAFFKRYQNIIVGVLVVVVGITAYVMYTNNKKAGKQERAAQEIMQPQQFFAQDSFARALNMPGGFLDIVDDYGSTRTGNLAKFYAGICFFQLGDFASAISYLSDFSTSSDIIRARAYELQGHAHAELQEFDQAEASYKRAADALDMKFFTPYFCKLYADFMRYRKDYATAKRYYTRIQQEFPESEEARDIERYLLSVTQTTL